MSLPTVLCFSGLDPSGGAGISADTEALAANGCHCAPIITALTVQDTENVKRFTAVNPEVIAEQADTIIHDMAISAIKIGMVGNIDIAKVIYVFLKKYPSIPVILDPVLVAGGGGKLASDNMSDIIGEYLLPCTTIATPNTLEVRILSHSDGSIETCAQKLLALGSHAVLVTGTHADTPNVVNTLFMRKADPVFFEYARLPHHYHGSGCTLASGLAAFIAKGFSLQTATEKALHYTYQTLKQANPLGNGQLIPHRFLKHGK